MAEGTLPKYLGREQGGAGMRRNPQLDLVSHFRRFFNFLLSGSHQTTQRNAQ
jgi:hypothetical protein